LLYLDKSLSEFLYQVLKGLGSKVIIEIKESLPAFGYSFLLVVGFCFCFQYCGLNSGPHTWWASVLLLEPFL
jgi:hypothetical protein